PVLIGSPHGLLRSRVGEALRQERQWALRLHSQHWAEHSACQPWLGLSASRFNLRRAGAPLAHGWRRRQKLISGYASLELFASAFWSPFRQQWRLPERQQWREQLGGASRQTTLRLRPYHPWRPQEYHCP